MECDEKEFGCLCKNVGGHFLCLFHGLNVKNYLDSIRSVTSCVPLSLKTAFLISSDNAMEISGCGSSRKKSLSALDKTATSFSLAVVFRN